ncbi:MAG TPA: hypothetical protein VIT68_03380 [Candidatus Gracilibacteria bacterium]
MEGEIIPTPEPNPPIAAAPLPPEISPTTPQAPNPPAPTPQGEPPHHPKKRSLAWPILKILLLFIFIVVAYAAIITWPLKFLWSSPSRLFQENLVIFFNEAETRPCGGFVTAFGTFRGIPAKYDLKNAYEFQGIDFGDAPEPLKRVSKKLNFWDLGSNANPQTCSEVFRQAYESSTKEKIGAVWLVNFSTVEKVFSLVAPIEIDGVLYTKQNFFSNLSRSVADIDRHNEIAVQERKKPLSQIGKAIIKGLILNPKKSFIASRIISESLKSGEIYLDGVSKTPRVNKELFQIIEWNLGGGKTSRFLHKELKIRLKENANSTWDGSVIFEVEHLGAHDEPLSQDYRGVMHLKFPKTLGLYEEQLDVVLRPGEFYRKEYIVQDRILQNELSFSVPRGQELFLDLALTAYPQQILTQSRPPTKTHENILTYWGPLTYPGSDITWKTLKDKTAPFVTLHEVTSVNQLPRAVKNKMADSNLFAEIHFNELVRLNSAFIFKLRDTNFENDEYDDPFPRSYELLSDQKTLILGFRQNKQQINERFSLSLSGVVDMWGNELKRENGWTIIPR